MLRHIDLIGAGEDVTILDAQQAGRVITMENCTNNAINNLTITGGNGKDASAEINMRSVEHSVSFDSTNKGKDGDVFIQAETIHLFMSKFDEPNTGPIILYAWESGKTIVVPCVLPNTFNLFHSQLNSFDDLSPGALGVLEPSPEKRIRITPESINLVIIPGVAFDLQGGRIGYGKGYYDRFLEQTKAFRLALAFDFQIIDKVPTEKHDVPMNGILSESGIFEVNN